GREEDLADYLDPRCAHQARELHLYLRDRGDTRVHLEEAGEEGDDDAGDHFGAEADPEDHEEERRDGDDGQTVEDKNERLHDLREIPRPGKEEPNRGG